MFVSTLWGIVTWQDLIDKTVYKGIKASTDDTQYLSQVPNIMILCTPCDYSIYSRNFLAGENFGKKCHSPIFSQPNSKFTSVAKCQMYKFANIFLAKTVKKSNRNSFTLPEFCAIQYWQRKHHNKLINLQNWLNTHA